MQVDCLDSKIILHECPHTKFSLAEPDSGSARLHKIMDLSLVLNAQQLTINRS